MKCSERGKIKRKPEWLRLKVESGGNKAYVETLIDGLNLHTVCLEANCPNRMECFNRRTATFMILGKNCTRNCRFCTVDKHAPDPVDPNEPKNVALAVQKLKLKHAVLTSPTRDDLPDEGAGHFRDCILEIKKLNPETTVEVLIPDMHANHAFLDKVFDAHPDVLNHNIETIPRLYDRVRPMAKWERSIEVLRYAKEKGLATKSGIMVGLGEQYEEVIDVFKELRDIDLDMMTVGQYLQPSFKHLEVTEYVTPETFKKYEEDGLKMGFKRISSGPLVRSSYHAEAI